MALDHPRALDLLTLLYGPGAGPALAQLESLLERHRRQLGPGGGVRPWSEGDVFLICYPDQVRSPGTTPLGALAAFCRDYLQALFGGLHLLPMFPSSSDDGFAMTDYRRVDPAFGDWPEVEDLGRHFRLMIDLVLNHASAHSAWFEKFRQGQPPYEVYFRTPDLGEDWSRVVRPRTSPLFTSFETHLGPRLVWTTFGPDQVDLDYRRPEVLLEMADLLLEYVAHGAEVVRLDAVAYIGKQSGTTCLHLPQTHAVVKLLRLVVRSAAPWVRLITETNVPQAENITYFGDGDEADMVYSFALPPLLLHALTIGDAGPLAEWAGSLSPPAGTAFFHFLASHDGIGLNGAAGLLTDRQVRDLLERAQRCGWVSCRSDPQGGERPYELNVNVLDMLGGVSPQAPLPEAALPRFLCAHAVTLALAGVPAVYFHSLVGSRGDAAAVRQTGSPRSINREKLERSALEQELRRPGSLRRRTFDGIAHLLRARRALPPLHPLAAQVVLRHLSAGVFGLERTSLDGAQRLICLHEVAGRQIEFAPSTAGRARDVLTGETLRLDQVDLGPYQVRWLEVVP